MFPSAIEHIFTNVYPDSISIGDMTLYLEKKIHQFQYRLVIVKPERTYRGIYTYGGAIIASPEPRLPSMGSTRFYYIGFYNKNNTVIYLRDIGDLSNVRTDQENVYNEHLFAILRKQQDEFAAISRQSES